MFAAILSTDVNSIQPNKRRDGFTTHQMIVIWNAICEDSASVDYAPRWWNAGTMLHSLMAMGWS